MEEVKSNGRCLVYTTLDTLFRAAITNDADLPPPSSAGTVDFENSLPLRHTDFVSRLVSEYTLV